MKCNEDGNGIEWRCCVFVLAEVGSSSGGDGKKVSKRNQQQTISGRSYARSTNLINGSCWQARLASELFVLFKEIPTDFFYILFFSKYPFQMMMMMSLVRYQRLLTDELLKFRIEFIEDISASLENWCSCSGCSVPVLRSAGSARDVTCDSLMANWFAQYFIETRWLCASTAAAYKSDATDEVWYCRNQSAFEWCGDNVVDRVASNHNMSAHTMQSFTHNTLARSVLCHWKMKMIKNWWSMNEDRREKERSSVEAINFIKKTASTITKKFNQTAV